MLRRRSWRTGQRLIGAVVLAIMASTTTVVLAARPAYAAPPCQSGGVYLLFARGSGAAFDSAEAVKFRQEVQGRLGGVPNAWAELGNLDGDNDPQNNLDSGEYPAVTGAQWVAFPGYYSSVDTGVNELIAHLNSRVTQPGCNSESIVLGGYSQGADVMNKAINDSRLSAAAKERIAYVALYADPSFYNGGLSHCFTPPLGTSQIKVPWEKGDTSCVALHGPLDQRYPYVPSGFEHKVGSWCDKGDGVCAHDLLKIPGTHTTAYTSKWILQSASEVALAAIGKQAYPPGASVGDGSIIESDEGHLYVYVGGRLFWLDRNNAAELDAFESQSIRLTGTDLYIPLHHDLVHVLEVNRTDTGAYSPGNHMPADNTFLYEYGQTQQYVVKYERPFAIGSQAEVTALGGQDRAVMVPPGLTDLQSHPAHWVENDLLQLGADPSVWHYTGDRGYRVPSVPTRDCLSVRWNRGVTLMPAAAWNYFPTHPTQQAACDFTDGQWLFGLPSNRQIVMMYGAGYNVGSTDEVVALGGQNQAAPVSDETIDGLLARTGSLPNDELVKRYDTPQVYHVVDNKLHYVGSPATRDCLSARSGTAVRTVPIDLIGRMQANGQTSPDAYCELENRQLLGPDGASVVYIKDGYKRRVTNPAIRDCIAVRAGAGQPLAVTDNVWNQYTNGPNTHCPYPPSIRFVQGSGQPEVWRVFPDGTRQHADGFCVSDPFTTNLEQFHVYVVPAGEVDGHALRDPSVFHASPENCATIP